MRAMLTSATAAIVFAGIGAVAAAPGQQVAPGQTARPGELTKGEVWVVNRTTEPVPMTLEAVHADKPIHVAIMNGDPTAPTLPPVPVRAVRPAWEYQRFAVRPTDESVAMLSGLGAQGWEATGVFWPATDGSSVVLLKRLR